MRIIFSIWIVFGLVSSLASQESGYYQDFEFWASAGVNYGITKKASAGIKIAQRHDYNASRVRSKFAHLSFNYDIHKSIKLKAAYRITNNTKQINKRWIISGGYKHRVKPFDLVYRLRLEHDVKDNEFDLVNTLRNRVTLRYKRKKHDYRPFVSMESFVAINTGVYHLDRMRYKLGVDYKLAKHSGISLSYGFQRDYNNANPTEQYIISGSYTYDW